MHAGARSNPPGRRRIGRAKTRPKLRKGLFRRAVTTAAELAPGDETTWRALTDPAKRAPQPRTAISADLLEPQADPGIQLGPTSVAAAVRDARRGGATGLSGMRAEHLKLLLQDVTALELLAHACTRLANAQVPADVVAGLAMCRLTALQKPGGGVRISSDFTAKCYRGPNAESSRTRRRLKSTSPGPVKESGHETTMGHGQE